ncbi:MAG: beta-ketoacyl synthase N-terminal-like domain-containing protein [Planctomycetota bacterium]|nr:beta-ketoacyl synthase N-terminal-like domain-containing protein [Planctomycetota bacterium]
MTDRPAGLPEIAITAAAIRCSLGLDRGSVLDAMLGGKVGIDEAPGIEGVFLDEPGRRPHAAQAMPTGSPRSDRAEKELNACITSALAEARLLPGVVEELRGRGLRVETVFGTTLGGMRHLGAAFRTDSDDEYARTLTGTLNRDCLVGTGLQLGGSSISAACASGVSALSLAATSLLLDEADVVVAIAYDPISEFSYAGFDCLRLVAPGPLRPFSADREGMRVGEGYAAFVLERGDDAEARGAVPLGRLLGWGAASDAHHLTQPAPDGRGAARAIRDALVGTPDLVLAHATSTPANDAAEYASLSATLGSSMAGVPVTALKSRIGHTLAAAGAVELGVALAAMERGVIPPAANAEPDRESFPDLDLVVEPRSATIDRCLVVSLGFGGADAAISVESASAEERRSSRFPWRESDEVVVTGVGRLVPDRASETESATHRLEDDRFDGLDQPRAVRRLARFARLVRAVGRIAVLDAGLGEEEIRESSAFVGTRFGAAEYTLSYYRELISGGLGAGNPLHFAESVPNIGSAQLSLGLGIEGFTLSTSGTRMSGFEAMHLARRQLVSGQADRAIVAVAEEADETVRGVLQRLGLLDDRPVAEGAVAFVLERRSVAEAAGREAKAMIGATRIRWPEDLGWRPASAAIRELAKTTGLEIRGRAADGVRSSSGDRLIERAVSGAAVAGDLVERHSVGPMLDLAETIVEAGSRACLARDECGGAAIVEVQSI